MDPNLIADTRQKVLRQISLRRNQHEFHAEQAAFQIQRLEGGPPSEELRNYQASARTNRAIARALTDLRAEVAAIFDSLEEGQ